MLLGHVGPDIARMIGVEVIEVVDDVPPLRLTRVEAVAVLLPDIQFISQDTDDEMRVLISPFLTANIDA